MTELEAALNAVIERELNGMVRYGIAKSDADLWVHVLPRTWALYFYHRSRMLQALTMKEYPIVDGKSYDRSKTGRGFLVSILEPFIGKVEHVPPAFFDGFDWQKATDDAGGKRAEEIVRRALEQGYFPIVYEARRLNRRQDQFTGRDFSCRALLEPQIEVKLDRPASHTLNLFVQFAEYKHKVHGARG